MNEFSKDSLERKYSSRSLEKHDTFPNKILGQYYLLLVLAELSLLALLCSAC